MFCGLPSSLNFSLISLPEVFSLGCVFLTEIASFKFLGTKCRFWQRRRKARAFVIKMKRLVMFRRNPAWFLKRAARDCKAKRIHVDWSGFYWCFYWSLWVDGLFAGRLFIKKKNNDRYIKRLSLLFPGRIQNTYFQKRELNQPRRHAYHGIMLSFCSFCS